VLKQVLSEETHAATAASEARAEELQSTLERSRRGWQDESAAKDQALARLQERVQKMEALGKQRLDDLQTDYEELQKAHQTLKTRLDKVGVCVCVCVLSCAGATPERY